MRDLEDSLADRAVMVNEVFPLPDVEDTFIQSGLALMDHIPSQIMEIYAVELAEETRDIEVGFTSIVSGSLPDWVIRIEVEAEPLLSSSSAERGEVDSLSDNAVSVTEVFPLPEVEETLIQSGFEATYQSPLHSMLIEAVELLEAAKVTDVGVAAIKSGVSGFGLRHERSKKLHEKTVARINRSCLFSLIGKFLPLDSLHWH